MPINTQLLPHINAKSKRENGKQYYVDTQGKRFPSVTTILNATKPQAERDRLNEWKSRVGIEEATRISTTASRRGTQTHKQIERYLLGDNHISSNNIPMTAPVETRYPIITLQEGQSGKADEVGQAEVSFLYRDKDVHPQNVAQGIQVEDHPAMTVVSIGLQGAYTFTSYQQNLERLREWLRQHPNHTVSGSPRRFFYDSPFTPDALKSSEVQIPIK